MAEAMVLDMKPFLNGSNKQVFVEQLREQCHKAGLFYVKNHGVSQQLCRSMMAMSSRFFQLPLADKMSLDYRASPQFRGYMQLGIENTAGLIDHREQLDLGPDEVSEACVGGEKIYPLWRRLRGPNQWPREELLPGFKAETQLFMSEMVEFSMKLMAALALSLGLSEDNFNQTFGYNPHFQMKLVKYPPQNKNETSPTFGVGPHSDSGYLSLLLQDEVGGLQAQLRSGEWMDVPFKEGTFVVNLGEMLQLATNGYYLATVHRVLSSSRTRFSIPFFFNPRLDVKIEASTGAALSSTHGGENKLLPVFGDNTFKSFARSHPEVVRAHHADLLPEDGSTLKLKF